MHKQVRRAAAQLMERYNYLEAVKEDVKTWIRDHESDIAEQYADENNQWVREDNRDEVESDLNDRLFFEDSVTGNASGSYTFNAWTAEENICHNFDLLRRAFDEFGYMDGDWRKCLESAEECDVTIRCYLLAQAISEVLDEFEE